jgi:hypothetical protein
LPESVAGCVPKLDLDAAVSMIRVDTGLQTKTMGADAGKRIE